MGPRNRIGTGGAALLALLAVPAVALASGGEHHDGPLTLGTVTHSWEFWVAVTNFGLLCAVLYVFAKQPLRALIETRRAEVERSMTEAAELKDKAQSMLDEYTRRLATLDQELDQLKADIKQAAEEEKARVLAQAEETAARMKRETEALVERQAEQLEHEVKRQVVQAAVAAAEQELRKALTPDDQKRLADDFQSSVRGEARP